MPAHGCVGAPCSRYPPALRHARSGDTATASWRASSSGSSLRLRWLSATAAAPGGQSFRSTRFRLRTPAARRRRGLARAGALAGLRHLPGRGRCLLGAGGNLLGRGADEGAGRDGGAGGCGWPGKSTPGTSQSPRTRSRAGLRDRFRTIRTSSAPTCFWRSSPRTAGSSSTGPTSEAGETTGRRRSNLAPDGSILLGGVAAFAGSETAGDIPLVNPFQSAVASRLGLDGFVARLAADRSHLVYSSYIGGGVGAPDEQVPGVPGDGGERHRRTARRRDDRRGLDDARSTSR